MTTIPASQLVAVNPNVLSVGGNSLVLNGLLLSLNNRLPANSVVAFPNDGKSVANYFGSGSTEAILANNYFAGFDGSTQKPNTVLFARALFTAVPAWLRGGPVSQLTLAQLQGLSGSLTLTIDGYVVTNGSINLSSATSFSSAATILQTALNNSPTSQASVTGSIAAQTASVTGSISGNVLTVTAVGSGTLVAGAVISGTGITAGTQITYQLSGTTGGIGTYAVSLTQNVPSTTVSVTYGTLTVTAVASGSLAVGQTISGAGITSGTQITQLGTGTGANGTYFVQTTQTASSTTVTATVSPVTVVYDSVSGAFIITAGDFGAQSSMSFATGTLATPLFLTSATGAVNSQGAPGQTPATLMTALAAQSQNWATFLTTFDPDDGNGNAQKLAFATWTNGQNNRYGYLGWDTDVNPTLTTTATSSLGDECVALRYSGTVPIYDPANGASIAAFVAGSAASIDFGAANGRITFAFKTQTGLTAGVTDATVANNLLANSYNFFGAYATANQQFLQYQDGSVTGPFAWFDSYINQIWLNNSFQLSLMNLLQNSKSIPYNNAGYDQIKTALADDINAAINFGAIRAGVPLSASQSAQVNAAAGLDVTTIIQNQGWYLQVLPASSPVRIARTSPPINFWYQDGESVQQIVLNSVLIS